jgi:regulator of sigma E protease
VNIFIAIIGLSLLVLVHEAGHFFSARAVGMSPRRFYIGFPPALAKVKRKGIEYGIGAVPLGGYVKIPGMHRPAPSDLSTLFGAALEEAPQLVAPIDRIKRKLDEGDMEGARGQLPALAEALQHVDLSRMARRSAEKGLNELADGLGADAYWRQRTWKKVLVIFAGPGTNLLFAVILFATLFVIGSGGYRLGFSMETGNPPIVHDVRADHPAATIGLRPGDRILRINGQPVQDVSKVPDLIQQSHGGPITLVVRHKGDTQAVRLRPVRPRSEPKLSVPQATWQSVKLTGVITKEIGASLSRLVRGNRKEVSSPVGIVEGSSEALSQGLQTYLWVLGLLSLSLALLNLLPFLPLDGGHIVFSLIEGIRGRAVGREVYERASAIGIAVVLLLFFIGLSNDIGNLGN